MVKGQEKLNGKGRPGAQTHSMRITALESVLASKAEVSIPPFGSFRLLSFQEIAESANLTLRTVATWVSEAGLHIIRPSGSSDDMVIGSDLITWLKTKQRVEHGPARSNEAHRVAALFLAEQDEMRVKANLEALRLIYGASDLPMEGSENEQEPTG